MLKRWFTIGGILLLVSLLLIGCGVPEEDYDAVVAERDSTLAELQSVQSDLNSTQSTLNSTQAEVADLTSELEQKQQQLSEVERILDSIKQKLEMQRLLAEFCNKLLWYKLPGSSYTWQEFWSWARGTFRVDMENYLEAVDNTALRFLYEDAIVWETDAVTCYYADIDEFLDLLDELATAEEEELRAVLAD
jgi:DNA repair exonuclease SbcCD ATPase subunit